MILLRQIVEASDVPCRYDEKMDRGVRMDILNHHNVFIPIQKIGGLFTPDNLTEDTIFHIEPQPRYCINIVRTDMGKPFVKVSACLREAASAKAGANLWLDGPLRS